jgi:hypothetical protein
MSANQLFVTFLREIIKQAEEFVVDHNKIEK